MAERETLADPFVDHRTAPQPGNIAVMIAGDPDPFQRRGHRDKPLRRFRFQPRLAAAIVIIVTEAEDRRRAGCADQIAQFRQRGATVIGRQHLPLTGVEAGFFQMQVGDQQSLSGGPVKRRRSDNLEAVTGEQKGNHGAAMR